MEEQEKTLTKKKKKKKKINKKKFLIVYDYGRVPMTRKSFGKEKKLVLPESRVQLLGNESVRIVLIMIQSCISIVADYVI